MKKRGATEQTGAMRRAGVDTVRCGAEEASWITGAARDGICDEEAPCNAPWRRM